MSVSSRDLLRLPIRPTFPSGIRYEYDSRV